MDRPTDGLYDRDFVQKLLDACNDYRERLDKQAARIKNLEDLADRWLRELRAVLQDKVNED